MKYTCWVHSPACRCSGSHLADRDSPVFYYSGGGYCYTHPPLGSAGTTNYGSTVGTEHHSHLQKKHCCCQTTNMPKPHNTLCLSCNSMQRSFISIISGKTTGVKHTIQSSLETAPFSILATVSAPAALWSGNALGALSELGALGRTRIFIWEQTATLTRLTAQWNKGWTHALKENQKQQQSKFSCMAEATK